MDNLHPQSGGNPGHETGDLSVSGVVKSAVVLTVMGILAFVAAKGIVVALAKWEGQPAMTMTEQQARADRQAEEDKAAKEAAAAEPGVQLSEAEQLRIDTERHLAHTFPEPRLQYDDVSDMQAMRADEAKKLGAAGKDGAGNLRIPIDQAMEALVKDGLPPVTGTFTPVNTAPTSVIVPMPGNAQTGKGVTKR